MNRVGCVAVLSATAAFAAVTAAASTTDISISTVSFITRPPYYDRNGEAKDLELSGITYAGDDVYYAVDDKESKLYKLTIGIDRETGRIRKSNRKDSGGCLIPDCTIEEVAQLADSYDAEGCAYDPASGNVWVAQEKHALIREFEPKTGKIVRSAPVPDRMKRYANPNLSLESLTISGDGKRMWTCNEEGLLCDGSFSTKDSGSLVRMTMFGRSSVYDDWSLKGQHAYLTEPVGIERYDVYDRTRSGVAGLCVLPDNSLLVLERCCQYYSFTSFYFYHRIYRVSSCAGAESTLSASNLTSSTKPLQKTLLWQSPTSSIPVTEEELKNYEDDPSYYRLTNHLLSCNFECLCLGPRLNDDSCVLVMTTDSGRALMTLKLTGLDIHNLEVRNPSVGKSSFAGKNYRFLSSREITLDLLGEGVGPKAYTNRDDHFAIATWTLVNQGLSGKGTHAKFSLTNENTVFKWYANSASYTMYAASPIYAHDTFEEYDAGTCGSKLKGWRDKGEVVADKYTPYKGGYVLNKPNVTHTKSLDVEDGAVRKLPAIATTSGSSTRMDMMVEVRYSDGKNPPDPEGDSKFAIAANNVGILKLWHRGSEKGKVTGARWSDISSTRFASGTRVRVSAEIKYASSSAFGRVRINGSDANDDNGWCQVNGGCSSAALNKGSGRGQWFPIQDTKAPMELSISGTKVDDFVLVVASAMQSINNAKSIMVSPAASGSSSSGVAYSVSPVAVPEVASPAVASSLDASATPAPVITGFTMTLDMCPSIRFAGYSEKFAYRVVRSTSVDFRSESCECPEGVFTTEGCKEGEAIWTGEEPDSPASGAKFYRVEVVEAALE